MGLKPSSLKSKMRLTEIKNQHLRFIVEDRLSIVDNLNPNLRTHKTQNERETP